MYCKHCGNEMNEGVEYCPSCGKRQNGVDSKKIYGHEWTRLKPPKERRNPKAAAALGFFLSWIFLGPVGYIYLGQWNWFWLTFIIQIFAYPLTAFFAYPLLPIVYGIHQYQMAQDVNELFTRVQNEPKNGAAECPPGEEPAAKPEA